jgi:uncharacterized protein (PEP-CTERM system associated)
LRTAAVGAARSAWGILLVCAAVPAHARLDFNTSINVYGLASTNPDLAPRGQEEPDLRLIISPSFSVIGTVGERLNVSASFDLGASVGFSTREGVTTSAGAAIRPSGALNTTFEVVDNFFYVDVTAGLQSGLNSPFLATTDRYSPTNTSTSYQVGISPYIRGTLFGDVKYQVRSDNYWTDNAWGNTPDYSGQYSATNTVLAERSPRPLGWAFSYQQQLVSSAVEGQDLLDSETARFSLRYALTSALAIGARLGAEKYNYTFAARDWQRFYGAEIGWRPNDRTSLEGYWEDRIYGNSWQAAFTYRRPQMALNIVSSRLLSNTPQQFLTFPGLASLVSLLNAALTTRIPDPIQRQRAVVDFLSQTQLPAELLMPTIIFSENFTIQELNNASLVYYGKTHSLAFTVYQTVTEYSAGISASLPFSNKTKENGTQLAFNTMLNSLMSATASASWRYTENMRDTSQHTTQTELRFEVNRSLTRRMDATMGARYQWVASTVTNDATEAAIYFTLTYSFNR